MRKCKPRYFLGTNCVLLLNLLVFWSIRSMWSGIIGLTAKPVPYILCGILAIFTIIVTGFNIHKKYPRLILIGGNILNLLFIGLNGYMISVTVDSLYYFVREFLYSCCFAGVIGGIALLFYYADKIQRVHKKWMIVGMIPVFLLIGFFHVYDLQLVNRIDKTPVVYAVGDTYQITFTTQAKGEAWVVIDGVEYNETYAGGRKSENTIHKITVPMSAIDTAESYTVYTRAMLLRGPYELLQGKLLSETYRWKGINSADGIQYYALSDNHLSKKAPAKAAGYWGESLDFLIFLGDTVNWIDHENELTQLLYLASDITKGEIPVISVRGNHETYGTRFEEYHNYVGADGEKFYYTFRIENVWGIVLDLGVDHADDYIEYGGTAKFDYYREEQTQFLDKVLENADTEFWAEGIEYRIGVCHIPLTFSKLNDPLIPYKNEWISRLNQMELSVMYSGHLHDLMFVDASLGSDCVMSLLPEFSGKEENNTQYIMSDANFPSVLVSKRGKAQSRIDKEDVFDSVFIGVAAEVKNDETTLRYTNESGDSIETISPWIKNVDYGKEIRIKNKK